MHAAGPRDASGSQPDRLAGAVAGLTRRSEFLAVRQGRSWRGDSLVLQARKRDDARIPERTARFGYTATKALGNAVERNRARRRLREAVRRIAGEEARAGFDYVLIARKGALTQDFAGILEELRTAFRRVHGARQTQRR
ncbi:MAG: ribonuclease P protein component [Pseudomonadota bacterium]|nr:ribonuclease P protein component [Pseudomonadota bacterium]